MTDKDLRRDVLDEPDFDPSLDADAITIRDEGDCVTLEGAVSSLAERDAAERAAWSVPGGRGRRPDRRPDLGRPSWLMERTPPAGGRRTPAPPLPSRVRRPGCTA